MADHATSPQGETLRGPHALVVRRDAAQATYDSFVDRPFAWGSRDCGQMLKAHLRNMGHQVKLAGGGEYQSLLGAQRALRRLGYGSLAAALDARYPRILPAEAIVGDVLALPSTGKLDAIFIALGNGAAIGFVDGHECAVAARLQTVEAAWRVDP